MNYDILRQKFRERRHTSGARINGDSKDLLVLASGEHEREFADAAVLLPIFQGPREMEVLLTKRAPHLRHHAGQISFPGGRQESHDVGLEHTALRETHEEIGIGPDLIEVIGHLPRMYTISYFDVDPVVGLVQPGFELRPDRKEVESIFSVPLAFFSHAGNQRVVERTIGSQQIPMVEFCWEDHRIWGATAAMIMMLVDVLWNSAADS